jgi:RHS repeat-associated protein
VLKKLITAGWFAILCACCQLANAASTISVTATPSKPTAPANVTLSAMVDAGSDPVLVTQVEYFKGGDSLGVVTAAPFTLVVNNFAAGSYAIYAKATVADAQSTVLTSPALMLTVAPSAGAANVYFMHSDQLNTPRAVTDSSGNLVWHWDSDPFGNTSPNEQPAGQTPFVLNQRFPGQYYDKETNLHYNYYRDYDPSIGRYIQSDPIGLLGGINTFAYVRLNPLSFVDQLGLEAASTIQCDGKGGYEVVVNDRGPARDCTTIHEKSHVNDCIERYGKDSCKGKERGFLPMENTAEYRYFRRDSECRAFEAEKACVKKCDDENDKKAWVQGYVTNRCADPDSWQNRQNTWKGK